MKTAIITLYGVQVYSVIVTILVTPLLVTFLGVEGYGLIGLYFVIQMLLQVVDGGLTGTITKLSASLDPANNGSMNSFNASFWYIKKQINKAVLALLLLGLFIHQSNILPWLIESSLSAPTINNCIYLMLICIAIRFLSLPDRGLLQGIERQKSLAMTNFVSVTFRYPVSILALAIFSNDITFFFCLQLVVVLIEVAMLKGFSNFYLKALAISLTENPSNITIGINKKWLMTHSGSLWVISISWVLASQLDKLILSFSVPLEDYGIFSLALVCANLMLTMFIPINQVLMPRFVKLCAESDLALLSKAVFTSIQLYVCFFSIAAGGLLFFGEEILFLWTRDMEISLDASAFLGYLAFGNFVHGITNIIFITAYARDDLKEYTKRYLFHVLIFLPISIYSALVYKEYGVTIAWVVSTTVFFLHTAISFLGRIFDIKRLLFSIVVASSQLILVATIMYLFKSQVTLSDLHPIAMFVSLGALCLGVLMLNCLITYISNNYYSKL